MHRAVTDDIQRVERTLQRVRAQVHHRCVPVEVAAHHLPAEPVPVASALARDFEPTSVGLRWGPAWSTTWFRFTGQIPDCMAGQPVELLVDLGFTGGGPGFQAEGLAYSASGDVLKGIEPRTAYVPISDRAERGDDVEIYVEAAANPTLHGFAPTPLGDRDTAGGEPLYQLRRAELATPDRTVRALAHDIEVLHGLTTSLPEADPRRHQINRALQVMIDGLDVNDLHGSAHEARDALAGVMSARAPASAHRISAVGHAHIDSAWLWPVRETIRKCARTFANVVALADDYPDLRFACSSAQQYDWMLEHYPELFERIRQKVRTGQFVPVGGMWVESDTNLPGGEAMVRQFVQGKRFFQEQFGIDSREVWLPDSFGYSAALPQLARLAGFRWFLSQKMSWNQTNQFPHHSFWWEGIDGSRIFTHFPPADTYSAQLTGEELARGVRNFLDHGHANRSLLPFGYGDGGGGPTREMLEAAHRVSDLEGSPRVSIDTPAEFFEAAEQEYADAPVWSGEMYLEFHRGVYTSQVAMKQGNRRVEHLLREAELWSATAAVRSDHRYPHDELEGIWRQALLLQFHDILPGSSIAWVHREARTRYAELEAKLTRLIEAAIDALSGRGDTELVFNAAPFDLHGVPAMGAGAATVATAPASLVAEADGWVMANEHLRVEVGSDGTLVSIFDKGTCRELLAPGAQANLLQLHPDTPNRFDAWDIDGFYRNRCRDITQVTTMAASSTADGAAEVVVTRDDTVSKYEQRVRLAPGMSRLDFETVVDWQHDEALLKVTFPLDVHAERSAAEVAFGHVHRPTHTNTSWDAAKFEVCAHRWIHVGEAGYGAALVNATTYGHEVTRSDSGERRGPSPTTIRLSLVRAPRFPDPQTDRGGHTFRYALVVDADIGDAVREGYRINLPVRERRGQAAAAEPLVRVTEGSAAVESVKLADDRSGDVVVRLYEYLGGRSAVTLRPAFEFGDVSVRDLHEAPDEVAARLAPLETRPSDDRVRLRLQPFQVVTLRFARWSNSPG